jgi:DNA-binding response OmpR family regulator
VSRVLLLTSTRESAAEILPSLSLLDHVVTVAPASPDALRATTARSSLASVAPEARQAGTAPEARQAGTAPEARQATTAPEARQAGADSARPDAVLVDARHHLVSAKELAGQLAGAGIPILAIISEGAWAAITAEWGVDDVVLHTAGPGEVEARIRLAIGRNVVPAPAQGAEVRSGELVIDEATYSARIRGVALDLTFKEFELLKFLAQHPRRVFTRSQLLAEVWGYEYFGGTRTVDVHVRRLRAKLGSENESLIGTVRNVGYKFVPAKSASAATEVRRTGPTAAAARSHPAASRAGNGKARSGRQDSGHQDKVGAGGREGGGE